MEDPLFCSGFSELKIVDFSSNSTVAITAEAMMVGII